MFEDMSASLGKAALCGTCLGENFYLGSQKVLVPGMKGNQESGWRNQKRMFCKLLGKGFYLGKLEEADGFEFVPQAAPAGDLIPKGHSIKRWGFLGGCEANKTSAS